MPGLNWRADCWGNADRALYVGALYVGNVSFHRTLDGPGWRAWLMHDEDGEAVGWYHGEAEAKAALLAAATAKLNS